MEPTAFSEVKDSGVREDFPTGSRRDTRNGKGRYDLLSPIAVDRLARHLENGAKKYGDRNWEKGQPIMRYIDSALRHTFKWLEGNRDEDHLSAAMWNLQAAIHTESCVLRGILPNELLNDVPNYLPTKEDSACRDVPGHLPLPFPIPMSTKWQESADKPTTSL